MIYPPAAQDVSGTLAALQHRRTRHRRIGETMGVSVRAGIRIHGADEANVL